MGFQLGGAREQLSDQNGVIINWIAQGVAKPHRRPFRTYIRISRLFGNAETSSLLSDTLTPDRQFHVFHGEFLCASVESLRRLCKMMKIVR